MDISRILRRRSRKTVLLTIRVTPELSAWLRHRNYSPTGIFYEAVRQLGYRERRR